jgi:hypothetical protein
MFCLLNVHRLTPHVPCPCLLSCCPLQVVQKATLHRDAAHPTAPAAKRTAMLRATSVCAPASSVAAPTSRIWPLARRALSSDATSACCGVSGCGSVWGQLNYAVVVACDRGGTTLRECCHVPGCSAACYCLISSLHCASPLDVATHMPHSVSTALPALLRPAVRRPQGVLLPQPQVQLLRRLRPHCCGLQGVQRVPPAWPQVYSVPRLLQQVQKAGWVAELWHICRQTHCQWVVCIRGVVHVLVAATPVGCVGCGSQDW